MDREAVRLARANALFDTPRLFVAVSDDELRTQLVELAYRHGFSSSVSPRLEQLDHMGRGVLVADHQLLSSADPQWLEELLVVLQVGALSGVRARVAERLPAPINVFASELEKLLVSPRARPYERKQSGTRLATPPVEVELSSRRAWAGGRELGLRRAELNVLQYLMTNAARVVTPQELVTHVLGASGSGGAARTQVCELRRKLAEAGAAGVVETVRGSGYRFVTPERLTKI